MEQIKEQSAVEWLINEIDMQYPEINIRRKEWMVDKAKAIEKEQREKDFIEGYKKRAKLSGLPFDEASKSSAKELFNKTLKSE